MLPHSLRSSALLLLSISMLALLPTGALGVATSLRGAGSSFPEPVMLAQAAAFRLSVPFLQQYAGSNVTYPRGEDGSAFAVPLLAAKSIHFIGTDIALTAAQHATLRAANGYAAVLHIPQVLTGVVMAHNLPGWSNAQPPQPPLNFTADLLARIFTCQVRFWNDASLLAINPQLAATAAALNVDLTRAIVPIGRSDPSSTTFEFTDYVTRFGTAGVWPQSAGNISVAWNATCMRTAGDGGPLANLVNATAFALGYAKRRTAARSCVACALGALQTRFGTFVAASDASLQLAASTTTLPTPVDSTWAQLSMGRQTSSPAAYPATHFSFMVVLQYRANEVNYPEAVAAILADFMLFAAYGAGQIALPPFFVPLTQTLKDINVAFITQYLVKPPPTVPSAATRAVASDAKAAALTMAVAAVVAAMVTMA